MTIAIWLLWGCAARGPLPTGEGETWRAITASASHACAIRARDDRVVCWGEDHEGEVKKTPRTPMAQVSAGPDYTCGIERDSRVLRCWGSRDDTWSPSMPNRMPTDGTWEAVYAAEFRTCAIRRPSGVLVCWGQAEGGMEIDPTTPWFDGQPMQAAWVGDRMVCGLRADTGEATCTAFQAPEGPFVEIGEACGLREDGTLVCFGADSDVAEAPDAPLVHLGTGNDFTHCGLRASDRHPMCWGHPAGWLDRTPAQAMDALAVGWSFACGITSGGRSIMCWGEKVKDTPSLVGPE